MYSNSATDLRKLVLALALTSSAPLALAQHSSLQIFYANAGTTAPLVADCLAGTHSASDTRGCSGSSNEIPATAGSSIFGDGHALFPGHGMDTEAWARASFGRLSAFAQTTATNVDAFYNVQSRGSSGMTDFILASNTSNAAITTYLFTITVHGSLSAPSPYASYPITTAGAFVGFNVESTSYCPNCVGVVSNWSTQSGQPSDTVYSGTFSMVTGTTFEMRASVDVSSYLNVFSGQSANATADYGNTVTVQLSGLTGGANTVGVSGYNYASPVPEVRRSALMLVGLAALLWFCSGRKRSPERE